MINILRICYTYIPWSIIFILILSEQHIHHTLKRNMILTLNNLICLLLFGFLYIYCEFSKITTTCISVFAWFLIIFIKKYKLKN